MSAVPPPAPGCDGCAARDEEIALLRDQVGVLRAEQKELREKIARLERSASRNSGNSSMPPSADDLPGKTLPERRRRGGEGTKRGQGKQPGAPGSHLAWSEDPGKKVVPLFPEGPCACGRDLADAADLGVAASHQVVDVPL